MFEENNILQSVKDGINHRANSPFYGAFVITWLIWNWKTWYITFFTGEDLFFQKTGFLKINYLINSYTPTDFWSFIFVSGKIILLPLASVFFIFFIVCKIERIIANQHGKNELNKTNDELTRQKGIEKTTEKTLESRKKTVKKKAEIKKTLSQEEIWDEEYSKLGKIEGFKEAMIGLRDCIYKSGGLLDDHFHPSIGTKYRSLLHVNELFEYERRSNNKILLTEKGKYFMKRFINENPES